MTLRMGAASAIFDSEMQRRGWVQGSAGYQATLRLCDEISDERGGRVITPDDLGRALARVDRGVPPYVSPMEAAAPIPAELELNVAESLAAEPGGANIYFAGGGWAVVKRFPWYYTVECGAARYLAASLPAAFAHIEEHFGAIESIGIGGIILGAAQAPFGVTRKGGK